MADTRNLVVLGGSWAGLNAINGIKQLLPELQQQDPGVTYVIHLVDPSTHFWWRVASPRAIAAPALMSDDRTTRPLTNAFKGLDAKSWKIHQGVAERVDFAAKTVTIKSTATGSAGAVETLPYYAIVVATGGKTPTIATSVHTTLEPSLAAIKAISERLETAKSVVIGGGGPSGVEIAGEIGEQLNGKAGWFANRPATVETKVTVVTSASSLLPVLSDKLGKNAEHALNRVGADVIYGSRIAKVELSAADAKFIDVNFDPAVFTAGSGAQSIVHLANGQTLAADVFIPAIGIKPNTSFVPTSFIDSKSRKISTDKHMRIAGATNAYAYGDVASYSAGGIMTINYSLPALTAAIAKDLSADGKFKLKAAAAADKPFDWDPKGSQLVVVGRSKTVSAMGGWSLPSIFGWLLKGRDYMLFMMGGLIAK